MMHASHGDADGEGADTPARGQQGGTRDLMDRVVAQRRRVLRTRLVGAAGIVTLGVLGSVGVVRHRSARQVEEARASGVAMMALGTYDDLTRLSEQLGRSPGADDPSAPIGRARRAVDALRAAEFGDSRGVARDGSQPPPAVGASADAWITHAMRKIATGDLVAAAAPKLLADVLESLIGAVALQEEAGGLEGAQRIFGRVVLPSPDVVAQLANGEVAVPGAI